MHVPANEKYGRVPSKLQYLYYVGTSKLQYLYYVGTDTYMVYKIYLLLKFTVDI
jgi:hypothetical protein